MLNGTGGDIMGIMPENGARTIDTRILRCQAGRMLPAYAPVAFFACLWHTRPRSSICRTERVKRGEGAIWMLGRAASRGLGRLPGARHVPGKRASRSHIRQAAIARFSPQAPGSSGSRHMPQGRERGHAPEGRGLDFPFLLSPARWWMSSERRSSSSSSCSWSCSSCLRCDRAPVAEAGRDQL